MDLFEIVTPDAINPALNATSKKQLMFLETWWWNAGLWLWCSSQLQLLLPVTKREITGFQTEFSAFARCEKG